MCMSSSIWSGFTRPSMMGLRLSHRNDTRPGTARNEGYLLKIGLCLGSSTCSSSAIRPAAPSDAERLVEQFEQVEVILLLAGFSLDRAHHLGHHALEQRRRAGNDHHAERDAADGNELGDVQQHQRLAARDHEAAQRGTQHDNEANEEQHGLVGKLREHRRGSGRFRDPEKRSFIQGAADERRARR